MEKSWQYRGERELLQIFKSLESQRGWDSDRSSWEFHQLIWMRNCLQPCYSKCGTLTGKIHIACMLVRNAECQVPPLTYWISICLLKIFPGDSCAHLSLWSPGLQDLEQWLSRVGDEGNSFVSKGTFDNIWWNLVAATGISWIEARAAARQPTRHRTVSQNKDLSSPKCPRLRDPDMENRVLPNSIYTLLVIKLKKKN